MSPTMLLISQDMNPPPVFRDLLCCMGLPRIYKVFSRFSVSEEALTFAG